MRMRIISRTRGESVPWRTLDLARYTHTNYIHSSLTSTGSALGVYVVQNNSTACTVLSFVRAKAPNTVLEWTASPLISFTLLRSECFELWIIRLQLCDFAQIMPEQLSRKSSIKIYESPLHRGSQHGSPAFRKKKLLKNGKSPTR